MDRVPFTIDRNQNVSKMNSPSLPFVNLLSSFLILFIARSLNCQLFTDLFNCERPRMRHLSNDIGAREAISHDTSYTLSKF